MVVRLSIIQNYSFYVLFKEEKYMLMYLIPILKWDPFLFWLKGHHYSRLGKCFNIQTVFHGKWLKEKEKYLSSSSMLCLLNWLIYMNHIGNCMSLLSYLSFEQCINFGMLGFPFLPKMVDIIQNDKKYQLQTVVYTKMWYTINVTDYLMSWC